MKKSNQKTVRCNLVVGRSKTGVWGRTYCNGHLILKSAYSLERLQDDIKTTIESDGTKLSRFDLAYDISYLFDEYPFLLKAGIGQIAGFSHSLMRQFAAGTRHLSLAELQDIDNAIQVICMNLMCVDLLIPTRSSLAYREPDRPLMQLKKSGSSGRRRRRSRRAKREEQVDYPF